MTTTKSGGNRPTINSEGRADVVQHAHPDSGIFHFHGTGFTAAQDFILIDISDTANYPHTNVSYAHLEWLSVQVDSNATGDYLLEFGFLENVDATNGDFHSYIDIGGSKTAGNSKDLFYPFYPNGVRGASTFVAGGDVSLDDTAFQTDVNLASTLDTTSIDTPSGSGDMVLRLTVTAGEIDIKISGAYHSHA